MRLSFAFHLSTLTLAALLILPGCGGENSGKNAASSAGPGQSSTIIVDGSSTVFRISKAVQEKYSALNPEVTVVVDNHGTGGGFSRYLQGEVDIVDASRDAKPDETSKSRAQGIEWTRFLVGYDGITLVVNPKNTFVKSLTVAQLKALWGPDSKVKTWKDLDSSWPDRKIILYCPDHDSGTFEFFTEAIIGKARSQREDVQASADDNILVNGVAGDPDGLGYFGYAYFAANSTRLRAIAVQNGPDARPVAPTPDTVLDKSYTPLSRPLYIFVKNSSLRNPAVAAFVKYYLDNVKEFSEQGGYVSPTKEDIVSNEKTLAATSSPGATKEAGPVSRK
ncbi:MAG: PstS family phosphate ABC transporter substrate-binding protein [Isosphaeraceae bacterium]